MASRCTPLSTAELSVLARAALNNADDLLADAQILAGAERWPRAYALAVLSAEEIGKCMSCLTATAFAADDAERWERFWKDFTRHTPKFAVWAGRHVDIQDWGSVGSSGDREWKLAWSRRKSLAYEVSRRKMAALYVDCPDHEALTPRGAISEEDAGQMIGQVAEVVRATKLVFPDDLAAFLYSRRELQAVLGRMMAAETPEERVSVAKDLVGLVPWLDTPAMRDVLDEAAKHRHWSTPT